MKAMGIISVVLSSIGIFGILFSADFIEGVTGVAIFGFYLACGILMIRKD